MSISAATDRLIVGFPWSVVFDGESVSIGRSLPTAGLLSEVLLVEHESCGLHVADRPVGLVADVVPKLGVGRHLATALRSSPRLGGLDQSPANASSAGVLIDEPA